MRRYSDSEQQMERRLRPVREKIGKIITALEKAKATAEIAEEGLLPEHWYEGDESLILSMRNDAIQLEDMALGSIELLNERLEEFIEEYDLLYRG